MDASCKIQRSIHDVRLTYKYVSRILGTYHKLDGFFGILCNKRIEGVYLYEEKQNMEHSDGTLLWKDICRGERSCKEFAEVRNGWI